LIFAGLYIIVLTAAISFLDYVNHLYILTSTSINYTIGAVTSILIGGNYLFTNYLLKPLTNTLATLEERSRYMQRDISELKSDVGTLKSDVGTLKVGFASMLETLLRIEKKLDS
jgi:hypothetical protein